MSHVIFVNYTLFDPPSLNIIFEREVARARTRARGDAFAYFVVSRPL